MSLFKTAIALSLGVMVLPADPDRQEQLYSKAAAAAHWTATFCDRNGATCDNASVAWATFVRKAQFASKLAFDVVQRYSDGERGEASAAAYVLEGRAPERGRTLRNGGTLQPDDLRPGWRGSTPPATNASFSQAREAGGA
ncbi:MAG: hypothetical protein WC807_09860 [Hyphomicrobium sp.]|jgi:hypothetical protein